MTTKRPANARPDAENAVKLKQTYIETADKLRRVVFEPRDGDAERF
jgi:hypothetical protein